MGTTGVEKRLENYNSALLLVERESISAGGGKAG